MLRWQTQTQRACEALEWLVVETRGDDGWGCHLLFRGDQWGIAFYRDELCEAALAHPELFARSIIRGQLSEELAREAFAEAPDVPERRFAIDDDSPPHVGSLAMWPGERWLMADRGGEVILWDPSTHERISQMNIDAICRDGTPYCKIAVAPDALELATGDGIRELALWDLTDGTKVRTFTGHTEEVRGVAFLGDGRMITGSGDSTLRLWTRDHERPVATLDTSPIYCVARRPQGGLTAGAGALGGDGAVFLVDDSLRLVRRIVTADVRSAGVSSATRINLIRASQKATITCLAWHPDGRHLVTGGRDHAIKMFDTTTGAHVRTWAHAEEVTAVAITADGLRIVAGGDTRVRIWAAAAPVCLAEYECGAADLVVDGDRIYAATVGIVQLP